MRNRKVGVARHTIGPTRGITVLELLVATVLLALLIMTGHDGWKAFSKQMAVTRTLRSATSALQTARFQAIEQNRQVKVELRDNHFLLRRRSGCEWEDFKRITIPRESRIAITANPIFTPEGRTTPLCSLYISCYERHYRISISIAGRILVKALRESPGV